MFNFVTRPYQEGLFNNYITLSCSYAIFRWLISHVQLSYQTLLINVPQPRGHGWFNPKFLILFSYIHSFRVHEHPREESQHLHYGAEIKTQYMPTFNIQTDTKAINDRWPRNHYSTTLEPCPSIILRERYLTSLANSTNIILPPVTS